ncbi:hypothetical protein DYQ86_04365 [Acidobacteria bacterium AB60]|nr:hypothetical protein DYQ86_04365 [Acidobacteria bacterium AB60]
MTKHAARIAGTAYLAAAAHLALALNVSVNTDSAKAVLVAIQNPSLSMDEALKIARLPGNQGIIREQNRFNVPVTTQSFARALVATAHGDLTSDSTETALYFDALRPHAAQLVALTEQIEADPQGFQRSIEARIEQFTPPDSRLQLRGFVVVGGDGGGYSFGGTDFFLNLSFNDDLIAAKTTTKHEFYHAVQGAFAKERQSGAVVSAHGSRQNCANTSRLFADIYEEGSAMYVEDISTLSQSHSESAMRQLADISGGLEHVHSSVALLELSVTGLDATTAVPFDDVYEVGFYGHGVLYDIGYAMAKAIVNNEGPQGLAALLKSPSYGLILRYIQLPGYGKDKDHPKLGPNTIAAVNQLVSGCK